VSTYAVPPIRAVIFDFHATLVDQGEPDTWLDQALARADTANPLDESERAALLRRLDDIWIHAREVDPRSERDLSAELHHDVFHEVMRGHVPDDLRGALYEVMFDQWVAYEEAPRVIGELRRRGIRTAILSNIGIDLRPIMEREGLVPDAIVLSCEVGVVKPDPGIFEAALAMLGARAEETVMVGDNWADDAAASALGIRTLILPRTRGRNHGLEIVLQLTD